MQRHCSGNKFAAVGQLGGEMAHSNPRNSIATPRGYLGHIKRSVAPQ
jgi:hypothetical protein